jgi:rSAM/selenodomain-associated transferase 1
VTEEYNAGMGDRLVLLFTKPALPGRVKTRLIGELSPAEAADLHQAFLADMVERLGTGNFDLQIAWALEDGERIPEVEVVGIRQRGADLGSRLFQALADGARDHASVAAVGSDHPELSAETIEEGFSRLEKGSADAVLGPTRDGGYYLIGLKSEAVHRDLFEGVPWSSSAVLPATLDRCRALGLQVSLLPEGSDVDTAEDLDRLVQSLMARSSPCPRTQALLRSWGRLSPQA